MRISVFLVLVVLIAITINLAISISFWWLGERPFNPSINPVDYGIKEIRPQEVAIWRDLRKPNWPMDPENTVMHNFFGITHHELRWRYDELTLLPDGVNYKSTKVDDYSIHFTELGWPYRCIAEVGSLEWHGPGTPLEASDRFIAFGVLWPNSVLWIGMLINVLFYCAVISLAFLCGIYIRRTRRRRRGYCIKCAYNLRGDFSQGCPECGWGREK